MNGSSCDDLPVEVLGDFHHGKNSFRIETRSKLPNSAETFHVLSFSMCYLPPSEDVTGPENPHV